MANNFIQEGKTISITNAGTEEISSGDPVVVGDLVAVAITDIAVADTGDGFTEGVFLLPKVTADVVPVGKKVYLLDGVIQLDATDAVYAGYAWGAAAAGDSVVSVKLNG